MGVSVSWMRVQILVRTNSPPRAGNVTALPYKGSAFSTIFTFSVSHTQAYVSVSGFEM
jgi:hypothetical protein